MIMLSAMLAVALNAKAPSCLEHLQQVRRVTISAYDVAHDQQGETSISCNFGLTASEAADDLRSIVQAVEVEDCQSLIAVSRIPLAVEWRESTAQNLSSASICRSQAKIRAFLAMRAETFSVDNLGLLGWRGAFVANSNVLVNTVRTGPGRPHLKLVAIGPV